jgi:hypothetical protein
MLFRMIFRIYSIWFIKPLYPQNEKQSATTVKSCNALLPMILMYIRNYLKSVLRYKFLILDIYHPDTLYMREESWLFFEAKRGPREKKVLETMGYTLQKYGPQVSRFHFPINSSNHNLIFICFPVRCTLSLSLTLTLSYSLSLSHSLSLSSCFYNPKNAWWKIQIINSLYFLINYFP